MRFPIFFHGSIPLQEIADALASKGITLRSDPVVAGRMVADAVPRFLVKDDPKVVHLNKKRRA
jgi:hypothetical protein